MKKSFLTVAAFLFSGVVFGQATPAWIPWSYSWVRWDGGVPSGGLAPNPSAFATGADGECLSILSYAGNTYDWIPCSGGAPSNAQYWTGAADATLSAEKNLGALGTGLVINTAGVPSIYAGASCTNQFVRVLSASGAATCATVGNADVSIKYSKSISVENPTSSEKIPIFNTSQAATITKVCAVLIGSGSQSVTYNIKYGGDLSAAGTSVTTSPTAVTSLTTCTNAAALNNTAVSANDHVWLITTAMVATVNWLNVTVEYTIP